jgi:drug/metabolite transporter (DMT)-like permease
MTQTSNLRGIIAMVLACLTFVCCDSFLKFLLAENVPPLQALVLRGASATVWCFLLVVGTGNASKLTTILNPWLIVRSFCEIVSVVCFIFALANVPLADVTAIYQIAPLIVLAAAAFIWGEQVGLLRWLLIVVGLAGALLVAQPGGSGTSPYALLAFGTAIASAARDIFTRKVPKDVPSAVGTMSIVVMVMLAAWLLSSLYETWVPVTQPMFLYGLGAGFFVVIAHYFVFLAFRLASTRAVAPFYYGLTIFAVLFGYVLFREIPNTLAWCGIALIIMCGLGVMALENKKDVQT